MSFAQVARPLAVVEPADRVAYLKRVLAITTFGVGLSMAVGIVTSAALAMSTAVTSLFVQPMVSLIVILGSWGVANYVAPRMVFGNAKWLGFGIGTVAEGVALGYLLLTAVAMAGIDGGLLLASQAMILTAMTGVGLTAYVWTNPREFKLLGGLMSALTLPMLALMALSFIFPIGGTLGLLLSAVFVVVSAAGLLYQVNAVVHKLDTDQYIEGSYLITMGILVLFWNILSLLMRLNRR